MKKPSPLLFLSFCWLVVGVVATALFLFEPAPAPPSPTVRIPVETEEMAVLEAPQDVSLPEPSPEPDRLVREEPQQTPVPPVSAPQPADDGWVRVAIIIDDMGMGNGSEAVKNLPAEVTLSFLPYAPDVNAQVRNALARGHEIMLHLPMEPLGREYPGPNALYVSLSAEEIRARTLTFLDSFEGYVGVNNHMGSKFTSYRNGMEVVIDALRERGLYFVDSRTSARSIAYESAREKGLKTAARDIFLDDTISAAEVRQRLKELEDLARQRGEALAIGHPHAVTLSILTRWIPEAAGRGVKIVPASEIAR